MAFWRRVIGFGQPSMSDAARFVDNAPVDQLGHSTPLRPMGTLVTNGHWYSKGESLWALLNKLAYLNPLPITAWTHALKAPTNGQRSDPLRGCDLSTWGPISQARVAAVLREAPSVLDYAVLTPFTVFPKKRGARRTFQQDPVLRFCPICIANGLHSTLHQLDYMTRCPWHLAQLQTTCRCGSSITYRLTAASVRRPFACDRGCALWSQISACIWPQTFMTREQTKNVLELAALSDVLRCGQAGHTVGGEGLPDSELNEPYPWAAHDPRMMEFLFAVSGAPRWLRESTRRSDFFGERVSVRYQIPTNSAISPRHLESPLRVPNLKSRHKRVSGEYRPQRVRLASQSGIASTIRWLNQLYAGHARKCTVRGAATQDPARRCVLAVVSRKCATLFRLEQNADQRRTHLHIADVLNRQWRQFHNALVGSESGNADPSDMSIVWLARVAGAALVREYAETVVSSVLIERLKCGRPACPAPRAADLFDFESLDAPLAITTRPGLGQIVFHSQHLISRKQWRLLATTTYVCDTINDPKVDTRAVSRLIEKMGLEQLAKTPFERASPFHWGG